MPRHASLYSSIWWHIAGTDVSGYAQETYFDNAKRGKRKRKSGRLPTPTPVAHAINSSRTIAVFMFDFIVSFLPVYSNLGKEPVARASRDASVASCAPNWASLSL